MIVFNECKHCYKKATTTGCFTCNTYRIKSAVNELNDFIKAHKSNLSQFILYINTIYYPKVKSVLKLELNAPDLEIRHNTLMENNVVFIIIDKKAFDWGDIYLDMGGIY